MNFILKLFLLVSIYASIINTSPIVKTKPCVDQGLHGLIVEEKIPDEPIEYPEPKYVAPLIVKENGEAPVVLTAKDLSKPGHVGYVPAACIKGQLMPLDDFKEQFPSQAKEAKFQIVNDAQPIFDVIKKNSVA